MNSHSDAAPCSVSKHARACSPTRRSRSVSFPCGHLIAVPLRERFLPSMRSPGPALLPIFRSQHQAELLTWLLMHPEEEYGVTQLGKRLRAPVSTLHREVVRLETAGLITSRSLGRNRLLRANMRHPASRPLAELLELTFGPRVVVAEEFDIPGVERVVIFGSWASRYGGEVGPPPHDIDVLVVGDVDRADVYEAAERAQTRLGLEVNPVVRSPQEWRDPVDALVVQIRSTAHTVVIGGDEGEG